MASVRSSTDKPAEVGSQSPSWSSTDKVKGLRVSLIWSSHVLAQVPISQSKKARLCNCKDPSWLVCSVSPPWYNPTGWLGVKHQVTYLLNYVFCLLQAVVSSHKTSTAYCRCRYSRSSHGCCCCCCCSSSACSSPPLHPTPAPPPSHQHADLETSQDSTPPHPLVQTPSTGLRHPSFNHCRI